MMDVIVPLAVLAVLVIAGVLAGRGWTADTRDPDWSLGRLPGGTTSNYGVRP